MTTTPKTPNEKEESLEDLLFRLDLMSKTLEYCGRLDEHESPGVYATVLDAMAVVGEAIATPVTARPAQTLPDVDQLTGFLRAAGAYMTRRQCRDIAELLLLVLAPDKEA